MQLIAIALTAFTALLAFLALREARRTRQGDWQARELASLTRVGERLSDLGERIIAAERTDTTSAWALAGFTQREVRVALSALGEKYELETCREAVMFLVERDNRGKVYDRTKRGMLEVEKAMARYGGRTPPPAPEEAHKLAP